MTQELIANMLGVRGEGVTEAAEIAKRRLDSLPPGPHHGAGSAALGGRGLRVLRSGQARVRSLAPRRDRHVIPSGPGR